MRELIIEKLREIEYRENVRVLLAVEAGSRAWGFASRDSDYDVKFIYVRKTEDYLRLDPIRDVIELSVNDKLDMNGWDLQKALRLLHKSNPAVFEWFSSPIVYIETDFVHKFQKIIRHYVSEKRSLNYYINMAQGNYREYLERDHVKVKKYFYVLRPILACRWILDKGTLPPIRFYELMEEELPEGLKYDVVQLLNIKMNSPELGVIPRVDRINRYIEESIEEIRERIQSLKETSTVGWEELNDLFLTELEKANRSAERSFAPHLDQYVELIAQPKIIRFKLKPVHMMTEIDKNHVLFGYEVNNAWKTPYFKLTISDGEENNVRYISYVDSDLYGTGTISVGDILKIINETPEVFNIKKVPSPFALDGMKFDFFISNKVRKISLSASNIDLHLYNSDIPEEARILLELLDKILSILIGNGFDKALLQWKKQSTMPHVILG